MKFPTRALVLAVLLAISLVATVRPSAAVIAEMKPEVIRAAIAFGVAEKTTPHYDLRKSGFVGSTFKPTLGYFSTPFLRVAQAAHAASTSFKQFTVADVAADIVAPELYVYGVAQAEGARIVNVRAIVVTTKGNRDPASAIRPTRSEPIPVAFRNVFGLKAEGESLWAVFPIDVLRDGNEIHVIFDGRVHDGAANKYCEDCAVDVDTAKIR